MRAGQATSEQMVNCLYWLLNKLLSQKTNATQYDWVLLFMLCRLREKYQQGLAARSDASDLSLSSCVSSTATARMLPASFSHLISLLSLLLLAVAPLKPAHAAEFDSKEVKRLTSANFDSFLASSEVSRSVLDGVCLSGFGEEHASASQCHVVGCCCP